MGNVDKLCTRRQLSCLVERVHDAGAVQCSPALVQGLLAAVRESKQVCTITWGLCGAAPPACSQNLKQTLTLYGGAVQGSPAFVCDLFTVIGKSEQSMNINKHQ